MKLTSTWLLIFITFTFISITARGSSSTAAGAVVLAQTVSTALTGK